jgi:hypothetical protein
MTVHLQKDTIRRTAALSYFFLSGPGPTLIRIYPLRVQSHAEIKVERMPRSAPSANAISRSLK